MPKTTNKKNSVINIPLTLSKAHLNELVQSQFSAIKINDQQSIEHIKIDGKEDRVKLILDMKGRYNGIVIANFIPVFINEKKKVEITELQIQLENDGILSKGINWVIKSFLKEKIQEMVQNQVDSQLEKAIVKYLNTKQIIPVPQGLKAEMEILEAQLHDLHFENEQLSLNLELEAIIQVLSHTI